MDARREKLRLAAWLVVLGGLLIGASGCRTAPPPLRPAIALIPMGTTDEYWKMIHAGGVRAQKEFGIDLIWQGPIRRDDRTAQIDVVESMIVRGVQGIVLAPVDNTALRGPVEDAYRLGIPVVVIDSDLASDKNISFIATDNYKGGMMAGDHLAKLLHERGKVALLRNVEGNSSTDHRERGFLDAIKKYPAIQVVSSNQHAGATTESAYRASENLMAPFKTADGKINLDGIFCPNESSSFGMLRALQDGGLAGKVRFIGFDASKKLNEAVRKGEMDALVVQDPVQIGYLGVARLVDHLKKRAVPRKIDVAAALVTKDNLDQAQIRELIAPDLSQWLNE